MQRELSQKICRPIRQKFEQGNSLAKLLLSRLQEGSFRVYSFLPESVDDERTLKIDDGGLFESDPSETIASEGFVLVPINSAPATGWLIEQILDFLKTHADGVVVFEDALARREDPGLAEIKSEIWYYGDEVYHLVRAENASARQIESAIRWGHSIPVFVGAMSAGAWRPCQDDNSNELCQEDLRSIAHGTKAIIVGAYDGEGYLIGDELPQTGHNVCI